MQTTKNQPEGKSRILALAVLAALVVANVQPVAAQNTYKILSLANKFSYPVYGLGAIADNGTCVGYTPDGNALISHDSALPLDAPPGPFDPSSVYYTAINASLTTAGSIYLEDYSDAAAFVRQPDGRFRFLSFPAGSQPQPAGINNNGDVVGYYYDQDGMQQGFIADQKGIHTIVVPGATWVSPSGINASGVIVGSYLDENYNNHSFIMDNKGISEFTIPGATYVQANCINDNGEIGGGYSDGNGPHAFVLKGGKLSTIDYSNPNAPDTITRNVGGKAVVYVKFASNPTVIGINDRGDIVGYTFDLYRTDPDSHFILGFQTSFWGTRLP
jgi:hypothetical protein